MYVASSFPQLRPALSSHSFRHLSAEDVLRVSMRYSFQGVEWSHAHVPAGDVSRAFDVRRQTDGQGLDVVSYASNWNPNRGSFVDLVNTAAVLGSPTIRLNADPLRIISEDDHGLDALRRALDLARTAGITVYLAYRPDALSSVLRLLEKIARPNLRLCWLGSLIGRGEGQPQILREHSFYVLDVQPYPRETAPKGEWGAVSPVRYAILDAAPR